MTWISSTVFDDSPPFLSEGPLEEPGVVVFELRSEVPQHDVAQVGKEHLEGRIILW